MKGAGKGWEAWQAWEDKPCGRCRGTHLTKNCPKISDGITCNKCGRTGHTPACCTSKKIVDDETCRGCGQKGHTRKDCPLTLECKRCFKKGHIVAVCTQPADYKPDQKKHGMPKDAPKGDCRPCGEHELFMMAWKCPKCEKPIKDDSGTATKCPSCHTAREDQKVADVAPKSFLPQCKATTERELERAQVLDATGALPPTTSMQEAIKQAQELESNIAALEGMKGAGPAELVASMKKELAALGPKLPVQDQALKDHSDVRLAIKDLAEKRERGIKDLRDKIGRLMDAQKETVSRTGREKKEIAEKAAALTKIVEQAAEKKGQDQAVELTKLRKELDDATNEAAE